MIYADNAATTKLDSDAYNAMLPFMLDQFANASQHYSFSRTVKSAIRSSREAIAKCIHADPEEIFITSGGTESDNWALKGVLEYGDQRAIITSAFEHHAVLHACHHIEKLGYPVSYLTPSHNGFVTPDILRAIITPKTKLVSVMMVNNEIGTVQPIKELCQLAHQNGALFHTDAVQALGHIEINVKDLDVDMLSCSAHKFNGPKGIGFLYVKKGTRLFPYADGGAQEMGMRAGTENTASIVGMAAALSKSVGSIYEAQTHLRSLDQIILTQLINADIDFIRNGDAPHIPGNLSLSFAGVGGEMLLHRLDLMGIMVSTGSACDSNNTQISHVLQAIMVEEKYARGTIRISFSKDNTTCEAEEIANALIKIVKARKS